MKEKKERKKVCVSLSQLHITDGQLGMRSMHIYIGAEITSRWEIMFRALKGCDEVSQLAFGRLVNTRRGI